MDFGIKGKVALITAASRGLGRGVRYTTGRRAMSRGHLFPRWGGSRNGSG